MIHDVLHRTTENLHSLKPQVKNSVPWNSKKQNNIAGKLMAAEVTLPGSYSPLPLCFVSLTLEWYLAQKVLRKCWLLLLLG
jgi:hypothetical protein